MKKILFILSLVAISFIGNAQKFTIDTLQDGQLQIVETISDTYPVIQYKYQPGDSAYIVRYIAENIRSKYKQVGEAEANSWLLERQAREMNRILQDAMGVAYNTITVDRLKIDTIYNGNWLWSYNNENLNTTVVGNFIKVNGSNYARIIPKAENYIEIVIIATSERLNAFLRNNSVFVGEGASGTILFRKVG